MAGDRTLALEAARKVSGRIPDEALAEMPMLAGFRVIPYYAYIRFAMWDEMLREPRPPAGNAFLQGIWHYGRGRALVAKKRLPEAETELAAVRQIAKDKSLDTPMFSPNTMAAVFRIAPESLAAAIAGARKDFDRAIGHLDRAVRFEDGLVYTEPAEWVYPVRHDLAAVLVEARRADEAETVYWEDLRRNPENGWALRGLTAALQARGQKDLARLVEERFRAAWPHSDVALGDSRLQRP